MTTICHNVSFLWLIAAVVLTLAMQSGPEKARKFAPCSVASNATKPKHHKTKASHTDDHLGVSKRQRRLYGDVLEGLDVLPFHDVKFAKRDWAVPGPETLDERWLWMEHDWNKSTPTMKDRLVRNLRRMVVRTKMTGMGCAELLIYMIWWFVRKFVPDLPMPMMKSACDMALSRVVTLLHFDEGFGPDCIFWRVEDLLPDELREELESILPTNDEPLEIKRQAYSLAHDLVRSFFEDARRNGSHTKLFAPCARHDSKNMDVVSGCLRIAQLVDQSTWMIPTTKQKKS